MSRLLILGSVFTVIRGFSITEISASDGEDMNRPAYSGDNAQAIALSCRLQLNTGDHWTSCSWSHEFHDIWGLTNSQGYVMCSSSSIEDNQQQCKDKGNLISNQFNGYDRENEWIARYVDRLSFAVTETTCGLIISKPNANDTGLWRCHVNDNSLTGEQSPAFWSEINLFVANKSEARITDPVMEVGRDQSIWVDISDGQGRIQSTCQSMYGVPPPNLVWYIDEPSNKISSRDASITTRSTTGPNGVETSISSISMDIDLRSLTSYGVRPEQGYFSFALGCFPDQNNYFSQRGSYSHNPAEVMVFGKSGGVVFTQCTLLLVVVFFLASLL